MKRFIALMMLAVYLFAVGAPAYASVTCHCVAETAHCCCAHCDHDDSKSPLHFETPCCSDHHSTDIDLYTTSSQDSERGAKRLLSADLALAVLAETVVSTDYIPVFCGYVAQRYVSSIPDSHISSCGLRAPPVLV